MKLYSMKFLKFKKIILCSTTILFILFIIQSKEETNEKNEPKKTSSKIANLEFSPEINSNRINQLFKILHHKEKKFSTILDKLNLISFSKLISNGLKTSDESINSMLKVNNNEIEVKEEFVQQLIEMSRDKTPEEITSNNKSEALRKQPVVLTGANNRFFIPLLKSIRTIRKYMKDYKLIVYDLGIKEHNIQTLAEDCNCEIRKFDVNQFYSNTSPHVLKMKTYSWKPLIIQEVLNEYDTVIYMDSSGRVNSNTNIENTLQKSRKTGFTALNLFMDFNCYTDPRMLDWFKADREDFNEVGTIEANFLIFHQSLVTKLLMKTWVQCALDESCIAPKGSSTYVPWTLSQLGYGACHLTCKCHRYDQAALLLSASFFYGHPPKKSNRLPVYVARNPIDYWVDIERTGYAALFINEIMLSSSFTY